MNSAPVCLDQVRILLAAAGGGFIAQGSVTHHPGMAFCGFLILAAAMLWVLLRTRFRPGPSRDRCPITLGTLVVGAGLLFLVIAGTGCASASRVTTAGITLQAGTNRVVVTQPKDTIIGRLEFDPATGRLVVIDYQSTANAGAIEAARAQAAAQAQVANHGIDAMRALAEKFAESQAGSSMTRSAPPAVPATQPPVAVPRMTLRP